MLFETTIILAYLLPTLIAWYYKRRNLGAIFACNLLLGWTGVGWAGTLVWKE